LLNYTIFVYGPFGKLSSVGVDITLYGNSCQNSSPHYYDM